MEMKFFLKDQLARHGVTQKELAAVCGVTPQNFNKRVARGTFSFEELEKIANLCGCHFEPRFVPIEEGNRESD